MEEVIQAALSLQAARMWADLHPDDAHGADSVDLHTEMLMEAIANCPVGAK